MSPSTKRAFAGALFVAPAALLVIGLFVIPLGMTAWMSFYKWPLLGAHKFIGLGNYLRLVEDEEFWAALAFTIKYSLIVTPVLFVPALGMALLLHQPRFGVGFFRSVYFLPTVIGFGTASVLWRWMYDDLIGLWQQLPIAIGLIDSPWPILESATSALNAVVWMVLWKTVGFNMILLLTGLQGIPKDITEAAIMDGASPWNRLRHITLPLMRRTFALTLILSVTGSMLAFDQFYIITNGGPSNQTLTSVYWIYNNMFVSYKLGYGAALAMVQLGILGVVTAFQLWLLREKD